MAQCPPLNTPLKTSNWLQPQQYLYFMVFLYSKYICICLVGHIDFNVSETCLRVAVHQALLQSNLLEHFSAIIEKAGAMCEKSGIFKPLRIQLKCRSCFRSNFFSI